jgi:hypothetical protein
VFDELEQRGVGPVQVFDHEDERALRRHRLEKRAPGGEGLVAFRGSFALCGSNETRELAFDPRTLGGAREQRLDGRGQLVSRGRRVVGLEDAGVCLDDLAERPQRDAFPVRQAPSLPPVDELRLRIHVLSQLGREPALADARLADERDEVAGTFAQGAHVDLAEHFDLVVPADERRRARRLEVDAEPAARTVARQTGTGSALPFAETGSSCS